MVAQSRENDGNVPGEEPGGIVGIDFLSASAYLGHACGDADAPALLAIPPPPHPVHEPKPAIVFRKLLLNAPDGFDVQMRYFDWEFIRVEYHAAGLTAGFAVWGREIAMAASILIAGIDITREMAAVHRWLARRGAIVPRDIYERLQKAPPPVIWTGYYTREAINHPIIPTLAAGLGSAFFGLLGRSSEQ